MRLIAHFLSKPEAAAFSDFLDLNHISNQCEEDSDQFQIWVHNEEDVMLSFDHYQQFVLHPKNPRFMPRKEDAKKTASKFFPITYSILAFCCLVFIGNMVQERSNKSLINGLTPIQRALLFDEPKAVESLNGLMGTHGLSSLEEVNKAPLDVQKAFQRATNIPFWKGFFALSLERLQKQASISGGPAPLFEKIKEGQVWRFITPIFMHQDALHIFFNMAWLLMLGRQIELRLKKSRVLLLILLLAIFSNTSQYLMSGPYFLGFSGVITGLAGFIWARQSKAPWEGYQVQRSSLTFLFYFVLILFFISAVCFILNALGWADFNSSMANTAHISGGLLGLALGRCSFFARRLL
jgi:GlpG protein